MARFGLNNQKANNYAFFCPVSRLHLTRSNPIGVANGVTPAILRGLRSKVILDLDDAVDIENGVLKTAQTPPLPVDPNADKQGDDNKEEASKRGRRKKAVTDSNSQDTQEPEAPEEEPQGTESAEGKEEEAAE